VSTGSSPRAAPLRDAGFRGEILAEAPLALCTTWQIGGPAEILALPADRDDLVLAVRWAARERIDWRVLGNGSNVLVRDAGVRGLVLRVRKVLDAVRCEGERLIAGAGASFPAVTNLAASAGLGGLEFGAGIPGTVGGAIVMNAGWHEHETGNVVESVEFLGADGSVNVVERADCAFGYRRSAFRDRPGIVLSATFMLRPGDPTAIRSRLDAFAASRRASQPTDLPSCGSVYLKPEGDFAGRLIEAAGMKGVRVGDMQVSPKHANFFVNLGRGTAADAMALMERVESEVLQRFGVQLKREVEIW
jgi:UDP-N-acetylmuramate dehydrogenase